MTTIISVRPNNKSYGNGFTAPPPLNTSSPNKTGRNSPRRAMELATAGLSGPASYSDPVEIEIVHYYGFYGEILKTMGI
jgi:hypothetical protein